MNKFILTDRGNTAIVLNPETLEISTKNCAYSNIDYMYCAEEDYDLMYRDERFSVQKGDIIIKMYQREGFKTIVILKSEELFDYMVALETERTLNDKKQSLSNCGECVASN